MSFSTYIVFSHSLDRYYTGQTGNLKNRLKEHISGKTKSTCQATDWKVVYSKRFNNRTDAIVHERNIKGKGAKRFLNESLQSGTIG